jgi:hypothetical protein
MSEPTCENCGKTKGEHHRDCTNDRLWCDLDQRDIRQWKPAAPASSNPSATLADKPEEGQ